MSAYLLPPLKKTKKTLNHTVEKCSFRHATHILELRFALLACPQFAPDFSDGADHTSICRREKARRQDVDLTQTNQTKLNILGGEKVQEDRAKKKSLKC